eukprot:CAMPEP_0179972954 /NCGR_PEP_ID=MMETSP0983-20121128/37069_1 /TAXON_ID=483367 /ORGANISM="non described non described, Strain CCMP 2436" /LENGTH=34 /DNA_ID= /DNA_START= /DNA_END= /DNA_ORIENTATION=
MTKEQRECDGNAHFHPSGNNNNNNDMIDDAMLID